MKTIIKILACFCAFTLAGQSSLAIIAFTVFESSHVNKVNHENLDGDTQETVCRYHSNETSSNETTE